MKYTIEEIAAILKPSSHISCPDAIVTTFLTDSRQLAESAHTLFFAITTSTNDGRRFIPELFEKGVRNFIVSGLTEELEALAPQCNLLVVPDVVTALRMLGADIRQHFKAPVLAITGSNGKTIVKEWIWQLLRDDLKIGRSPLSYNSQIGVPLSLSMIKDDCQLAVIEAGISKPQEMRRQAETIRPDFGVITNIGIAHRENFGSPRDLILEKFRLFDSCKALVYCFDDEVIEPMAQVYGNLYGVRLYGWSTQKRNGAAIQYRTETQGTYTHIHFTWHGQEALCCFPYTDSASIQNLLNCLTFIYMLEAETGYRIDADTLSQRVAQLEPVAMRLEVKDGKNGCVLIDDAYNSDLQALELALDFQSLRSVGQRLERALILSDIYQSGLKAKDLYGKVADLLEHYHVTKFIGIGKDITSQKGLFNLDASFFENTESFLSSPLIDTFCNELVLIKGSRSFGFERISRYLALKSHTTALEVNLDAIVHNYKYFRSLLKADTRLVAMVKAEAYGLGAVEISKTLQAHGCDVLAVAVADEGVRLRQAGITIPIMVMNPEPTVFPICMQYRLEPEVYSFKLLDAFLETSKRLGIQSYPIHIKLDTGMHRLGFVEEDLDRLIDILQHQQILKAASVFSHLAGSDEDTFDDYTQYQWKRFEAMSSRIVEAVPYKVLRHILNSAGIERFSAWQCDQVRLGIGLYGISVANPEAVRPVASLKTRILQIHNYKKGDTIGYSRTTTLQRDSRIAVLPIGYADGLNRRNRGCEVLVNGGRAPIMGNVCMDVCMIDVTGLHAEEGDTVTIFGDGLTISEVAQRIGTIPYEVLTSVAPRVKRIYYHE